MCDEGGKATDALWMCILIILFRIRMRRLPASLLLGRAVKYVVREGSPVSEQFLLTYVAPNIANTFPRAAALVLARALLWVYYEESMEAVLEPQVITVLKN